MHRLLKAALAGSTAVVLAAGVHADSRVEVDSILGPWLTGKKGAVIDVYECGEHGEPELCGRIAWLRKPYNDEGKLKRDPENPEASLRDRPLCGIEVFTGLKRTDRNTWAFGHVYNPKDGKHYRAYLDAGDDGTVSIRGYIGIPLFGKSETWTRPEDIDIGCPES
ncbi:MAG: DUF2147 domain-containing protein [Gammaproteobacteria bacterium]|nr:DUF2147 domain-containing protein [Gammaproteobacteria bacterium]